MSAADRREELEAAINAQITRAWKYGPDPKNGRPRPVDVILAAADAYATAVADERIAGRVTERAKGRARLAEAAAETARRTP